MIWVIGGTKDARDFLDGILLQTKDVVVTTATDYGKKLVDGLGITVIEGRLTPDEMISFIGEHGIKKIADLSHPYATEVSKNAMGAATASGVEYFRYERKDVGSEGENALIFQSVEEIVECVGKLQGRVLITLGSNNVEKFSHLSNLEDIYFRILPKWQMVKKCEDAGILPGKIIAMQGPFTIDVNYGIMKQYGIKYMVTKKGGDVGGEREKVEACEKAGVIPIVLSRPDIEYKNLYDDIDEIIKGVMA